MAHVFDYGAAGDGTTDDTEPLQHAIDDGDGIVDFSKGTFRITRPLVIDLTKTGRAAVRGAGGTTRLLMAGAGPALRVVGDHRGTAVPASMTEQTRDRERFPTVSGIEIFGTHPEAVGIELRKTMQMTVSNVLIRQCKYALHLVERNRNFILADSHLYDSHEYGVFFDRCNLHQTIICGNHISYSKRAGIRSIGGDVHNLHITGNDIEYNNRPGVDASPNGEQTGAEIFFEADDGIISEVSIVSNTIQATVQPGGTNVRIWGGAKSPPLGAVLISLTGNVIGSQSRAIDLRHAQRIVVSGNTLYDSRDLTLFAADCSGLSISGNTVSWKGTDDQKPTDGLRFERCDGVAVSGLVAQRLCSGSAESGGGITVIECRDFSVSDCQLLDSLYCGVSLHDSERCRVTNNTIVDRREKPVMRHAVRVTGKSRHNLVTGNIVGGATEAAIVTAEGTARVAENLECGE
jgi:parallel beta-helix repeat protein